MDREIYQRIDALQDNHWWFCARRNIISETISSLIKPGSRPNILEAGCGTGGNLAMLAGFGNVKAFEPDPDALVMAGSKGDFAVAEGYLPHDIPAYQENFELVVALDVIEHVEQDRESLKALRQRLLPGGHMVMTVPAFPFLWSRHDETHHHFRRYTRAGLTKVLQDAGYEIGHITYYNSLLFPLIAAIRMAKNRFGLEDSADDAMPSAAVNAALKKVFASERRWINKVSMPFGVSLLAVARNPG